jgi:molybdate transport system ATP-binding protein
MQNIHIRLGDFLLEDVSLSIDRGDYLNVIGHTGAGKSILLECISGFFQPPKGRIFLEDRDITRIPPEKRHIGIVYQDYALLPHFTVAANIAYGLKKIQKKGIEEKVSQMAASLGIDHLLHRKPDTLSGGEKQRTALARSLVVKPKLLLMDEPFSALDPVTSQNMRLLLKKVIQSQQTTVIHVTHNLEDVWALAGKVAVLHQGKLLQCDTKDAVFHKPICQGVADFVETSLFEGKVVEQNEHTCLVRLRGMDILTRDTAQPGKKVKVALRPENIAISRERPAHNASNVFKTRIKDIVPKGVMGTLILEIGETLLPVHSTSSTLKHLDACVQDTVFACIPYDAVRIVSDSNLS